MAVPLQQSGGKDINMMIKIEKTKPGSALAERVKDISGVSIDACLQCRKCSNGCPVAEFTPTSPSEIIRGLQLGESESILNSEFIWNCASCSTCYSRCPMQINMGSVVDALRIIARQAGKKKPEGNMPLINRLLLGTMKRFGRTYDLGVMVLYKAGTFSFLKDTGKFPMLLIKRKIALLPPKGADREIVEQIFNNTAKAGTN